VDYAKLTLNQPPNYPIDGVPDADTKGQHDSWPAQGRLSEFPRIDADCENAGYDADDFGAHVIKSSCCSSSQQRIQGFDDNTCYGITMFVSVFLRSFDQPAWNIDNDLLGIA